MPPGHYKHANTLDQRPGLLQQMIAMRKSGLSQKAIAIYAGISETWVSRTLQPYNIQVTVKQKPHAKKVIQRKPKVADPERWPCGIKKVDWPVCYESRCLNTWKCEAYRGKR